MPKTVLIDRADLHRRGVKLHRSTLIRLEKSGRWPKSVKIGAKVYWVEEEVDNFLRTLKPAQSGQSSSEKCATLDPVDPGAGYSSQM